jgi:L-cysteine desulfidase
MLQLLNGVTPDAVHLAKQFVEGKKVTIAVKSDIDKLYVEAICRNETDSASVFIKGAHSNIVLVERNGAVMNGSAEALKPTSINPNELSTCPKFLFSDIYEFATTTSMNEIEFILEGGVMNKRISDEGLRGDYGLKGKLIRIF